VGTTHRKRGRKIPHDATLREEQEDLGVSGAIVVRSDDACVAVELHGEGKAPGDPPEGDIPGIDDECHVAGEEQHRITRDAVLPLMT
jgi:hypothetical protein